MKLSTSSRSLIVAAGLALFGAGAAFADDIFTARLQAATDEGRVAVRSTVWNCEGETCVARPNHSVSVSACRALARELGPISAYGTDDNQLTAEQLASCNSSARQIVRAPASTEAASN